MSTEVDIDDAIEQLRAKYGVPRALVDRMVQQESGGNDAAVSPAGARSRWQVMPATFNLYNKQVGGALNPDSPLDNAYVGLRILSDNYKRFRPKAKNDQHAWAMAIAGYHGSPDAVDRDLASGGVGIPDQGDGLINTRDHVYAILNGLKPEDFTSNGSATIPTAASPPPTRESVASRVVDDSGEEIQVLKAIPFEEETEDASGLGPLARGARNLARDVELRGLKIPATHPDLLGKRVTLTFDQSPTPEMIEDAYLAQHGYDTLGQQFRAQAGGAALVNLNRNPKIEEKDGKFTVTIRPTRGAIEAINAYATNGIDGLRSALEAQSAGRQLAARDVGADLKAQDGLRKDLSKIAANEILTTSQLVQNLASSDIGDGLIDEGQQDRNAAAIRDARASLPATSTYLGAGLEIPVSAAGTITRAQAFAPLGPAAFPAEQFMENADRGAEEASKAALLTAPLVAAGPIAQSVGADVMSPLARQLFMRGLGAGTQAGVTTLQGGGLRDVARETLVGAMFPVGGRNPPERPTTLGIDGITRSDLRTAEVNNMLADRPLQPPERRPYDPSLAVGAQVRSANTIPLENLPPMPLVERVEQGARVNKWRHRDFGLVRQAEDQKGVGPGKVRVIGEDGATHVIQRPSGAGRGNQLAIPEREMEADGLKVTDRRRIRLADPVADSSKPAESRPVPVRPDDLPVPAPDPATAPDLKLAPASPFELPRPVGGIHPELITQWMQQGKDAVDLLKIQRHFKVGPEEAQEIAGHIMSRSDFTKLLLRPIFKQKQQEEPAEFRRIAAGIEEAPDPGVGRKSLLNWLDETEKRDAEIAGQGGEPATAKPSEFEQAAARRNQVAEDSPPTRETAVHAERVKQAVDTSNLNEVNRLLEEAQITDADIIKQLSDQANAGKTQGAGERSPETTTTKAAGPVPGADTQAARQFPVSLEEAGLSKGTDRYYNVQTHAQTEAQARELIASKGGDQVLRDLMLQNELTTSDIRAGQILIEQLDAQGRSKEADELASLLSRKATDYGQRVDAFSLIENRRPSEIASYIERQVQAEQPDFKLADEDRSALETLATQFQQEREAAESLLTELHQSAKLETKKPSLKEKAMTLQSRLDEAAEAARVRLKERAEMPKRGGTERGASGIPNDLADFAIIGAAKLAKKGMSIAQWTEEMVAEFGDWVRDKRDVLYQESYRLYQEQKEASKNAQQARQAGAEGMPPTEQKAKVRELADRIQKQRAARQEMQELYDSLTQPRADRILNKVIDYANVPRSVMSSGDLSFALRQNSVFTLTEFQKGQQAFRKAVAALGPEKYKEIVGELRADPDFLKWRDLMKVNFTSPELRRGVNDLALREEYFASQAAEKIPVIGKVVQASERAFNAPLDWSRAVWAERFSKEIEAYAAEAGWSDKRTEAALKNAGKFINAATGRGTVDIKKFGIDKKFEAMAPVLSTVFFSPRYLASRLQLLNMSLNPVAVLRMEAPVRNIVMRKMWRYYGTQAAIQTGASLAGAAGIPVETSTANPNSPDWLKLKVGNTRYDTLAGLQQNMRLMANLSSTFADWAAAEQSGDAKAAQKAKSEAVSRFLYFGRTKLAPVPSLTVDWWKGKTLDREDFEWKKAVASRALPLYINDMYKAWKDEQGIGLAKSTPALLGIGVQTYSPEASRTPPERPAAAMPARPARP